MLEKIVYIIVPIFIVVSLVLIANHEPWRDEAQIWLIARDSPDFGYIINLAGYEGSPVLWIALVFPLAKTGLPYISMFILHFLLMLIALIVFLVYTPFSKTQKILFSFSYYIIYLYNIITRNYVLFVLFLFLIAAVYKDRLKKPFLYSVLIILLANSSLHGLIVAIVLFLAYLSEAVSRKRVSLGENLGPVFIMVLGFAAAVYQLLPPEDLSSVQATWYFQLQRLGILTNSVFRAFLPVSQSLVTPLIGLIGIPLFLISLGFFIRKPKVMIMYLISTLGLLSVLFLKSYGGARHDGLIFMVFVFCLWISRSYKDAPLVKNRFLLSIFSKKNLTWIFTLILAFQVLSAAAASYMELTNDFSAGKRTAMFLIENGFAGNNTFIASYPSYSASTILPYMPGEHPRFYYLEYQDYRSFMIWNKEYYSGINLSVSEIVRRVDKGILGKDFKSVLLILNRNETDAGFLEMYELIAKFNKAITADEVYYIYRLRPG